MILTFSYLIFLGIKLSALAVALYSMKHVKGPSVYFIMTYAIFLSLMFGGLTADFNGLEYPGKSQFTEQMHMFASIWAIAFTNSFLPKKKELMFVRSLNLSAIVAASAISIVLFMTDYIHPLTIGLYGPFAAFALALSFISLRPHNPEISRHLGLSWIPIIIGAMIYCATILFGVGREIGILAFMWGGAGQVLTLAYTLTEKIIRDQVRLREAEIAVVKQELRIFELSRLELVASYALRLRSELSASLRMAVGNFNQLTSTHDSWERENILSKLRSNLHKAAATAKKIYLFKEGDEENSNAHVLQTCKLSIADAKCEYEGRDCPIESGLHLTQRANISERQLAYVVTCLVKFAFQSTSRFEKPSVKMKLSENDREKVVIAIRMDKITIPKETADRFFELFSTGHPASRSGSWLAVASEVVESRNGKVSLVSGSNFSEIIVALPKSLQNHQTSKVA